MEMVKKEGLGVKRSEVRAILEQEPAYMFNLHQQKEKLSTRKYRPTVVTNLGYLHGDIGFFTKSRHYETPKTYQAGFLICKDALSRYTYLVLLRKSRKEDEMVRAFETLLTMHRAAGHTHPIRGISFDRERSVVSKKVQSYLKKNSIKFTAFKLSRSKAKFAEGGIRIVRTVMARLERHYQDEEGAAAAAGVEGRGKGMAAAPRKRWWNLLGQVADIVNRQQIVVEGKKLGFAPMDVREDNLPEFFAQLYKAAPAYAAAQFNIDPSFVTFKYHEGDYVRAKLIVTSSAVLGEKHSETNLTEEIFRIVAAFPAVTKRMTLAKCYRCANVRSGEIAIFDENDIVRTNPNVFYSDRHVSLASPRRRTR